MRVVFFFALFLTLFPWVYSSGHARLIVPGSAPLPPYAVQGAGDTLTQEPRATPPRGDYRRIFSSIEHGIASGSIGSFSQHMAPYLHVTLRGGESGYFSSSQAYYLLENYFKTRKLVNFDFSMIGESEANPYATGSAGFNYKGNREYVQVYVSLSIVGGRWQITRINIY